MTKTLRPLMPCDKLVADVEQHCQRNPKQAGKKNPDKFEIWAKKACWRKLRNPASAMWIYHGLRCHAASIYVRRYYREHGKFPTGRQEVSISYGPGSGHDIVLPPSIIACGVVVDTFYFPDECSLN